MSYIPPTGPATSSTLGLIKLAGDLSGTAGAPTVPALKTKAVHLVYTEATGWPVRPNLDAGAVVWIDPIGTAQAPTAALIGDTFINSSDAAAIGGEQLLTSQEMSFKADWVISSGAPTINTTAGTVSMTTQNDLINLVPVNSSPQGLYTVKPGKKYEVQVTPATNQTGSIIVHANFINASTAVIYGWASVPLASAGSGTYVVTFVTTTAPSDVQRLDIMISGASTNTAPVTLVGVSVKELA